MLYQLDNSLISISSVLRVNITFLLCDIPVLHTDSVSQLHVSNQIELVGSYILCCYL